LGAGNDRLVVKSTDGLARVPAPRAAAPDGLAGIPTDEDSEGAFLGWMIDGGAGDDRIVGSPLFDHIIGGPGSDVLDGRRGDDLFEQRGQAGSDRIRGGPGRDALQWRAAAALNIDLSQGTFNGGTVESIEKVQGGDGSDTLIGGDRPDMLQGEGGADVIAGRGGADLLVGDGESTFAALVAADTIDGGSGDDVLDVDNKAFVFYAGDAVGSAPGPADRLSCGDGSDRVDASASQLVPADCEGSRFLEAAATVALRPTLRPTARWSMTSHARPSSTPTRSGTRSKCATGR
jgi:RTX calcium-binding nonapeptide repeat (4 copies)